MIGSPDVLICDDSLLIRKQLRDILEKTCHLKVVEAENGVSAVEIFQEHRPPIVIMDIVMPAKSGLDALKEIIALDTEKKTKVIVASSAGTEENLREALSRGAYDFIQKPILKGRVVPLVMDILDRKETG